MSRDRHLIGRVRVAVIVLATAVWGGMAGSSPVAASPIDGTSPSSAGMPGAGFVRQLLSWGQWLGLAACGLAIIYGAATWAGFGTASAGRAATGKTYVIAGGAGAAVLGLLPFIVSMLFAAGRS